MSIEDPEKTLEALQKIILMCKRNGIQNFEGMGFKLDFTNQAVKPRAKKASGPDITKQPPDPLTSEEAALFWSAGYETTATEENA